jgi:hypothetical protein
MLENKMKQMLKGKSKRVNGDEIIFLLENIPNLNQTTYKKLVKAYQKGTGCNICLNNNEMHGSGFVKSLGRVGKSIGKATMKSGLGDMIINESVGVLPIGETGRRAVSNIISHQAHDMAGGGFLKNAGRMGKSLGKAAVKSGVGDILIDEGLKRSGMDEGMRNKVGKISKNITHDMAGGGFLKNAGRMGKSLGKAAVKSGVGDILIDEGLRRSGMDEGMRNKVGKISKNITHDMAGGGFLKNAGRMGKSLGKAAVKSGVGDILIDEGLKRSGMDEGMRNKVGKISKNITHDMAGGSINPYLPKSLQGGSLNGGLLRGKNPRYYNNMAVKDRLYPGDPGFHVNTKFLPENDAIRHLRGRGFIVH